MTTDMQLDVNELRKHKRELYATWHNVYTQLREVLPRDMNIAGMGPVWESRDDLWFYVFIANMRAFDFGVAEDGSTLLKLPNEKLVLPRSESPAETIMGYIFPLLLTGGE